jgi:hypothetical protein
MAKAPYQPPKQSLLGQTIDSVFLLALVFAALFAPLYLRLAGGGKTALEFKDATWAGWGQNATMQAAWEKLGYTEGAKTEENASSAADLIASRFVYIVFHWSAKEYRDVIDEKFNNK